MGTCLDKGIKVVSNAGGLNPRGCAEAISEIAEKFGLSPIIAYVDGDDLMGRINELSATKDLQPFTAEATLGNLDSYLTANAYLALQGARRARAVAFLVTS